MKESIEHAEGGAELLDRIKGMWRKLALDASMHSRHFPEFFRKKSWEERKAELQAKATRGRLRIDIATVGGRDMGFCITSVAGGRGEVESLFVEECSRGRRIGEDLVRRSVAWMDENGAATMVVLTVYGNEDVLGFYVRQDFQPISVVLMHNKERKGGPI